MTTRINDAGDYLAAGLLALLLLAGCMAVASPAVMLGVVLAGYVYTRGPLWLAHLAGPRLTRPPGRVYNPDMEPPDTAPAATESLRWSDADGRPVAGPCQYGPRPGAARGVAGARDPYISDRTGLASAAAEARTEARALAPAGPTGDEDWALPGHTYIERLEAATALVDSLERETRLYGGQCAHGHATEALGALRSMAGCRDTDGPRPGEPEGWQRAKALPCDIDSIRVHVDAIRIRCESLEWPGSADLARAVTDDLGRLRVQLEHDIVDAEAEADAGSERG